MRSGIERGEILACLAHMHNQASTACQARNRVTSHADCFTDKHSKNSKNIRATLLKLPLTKMQFCPRLKWEPTTVALHKLVNTGTLFPLINSIDSCTNGHTKVHFLNHTFSGLSEHSGCLPWFAK